MQEEAGKNVTETLLFSRLRLFNSQSSLPASKGGEKVRRCEHAECLRVLVVSADCLHDASKQLQELLFVVGATVGSLQLVLQRGEGER